MIGVERGFALEEPDGTLAALPELWTDSGIRMNEGGCDPDGRFYCGSMAYDKTPGAAALYRLDPDGSTSVVLEHVTISNGLEWSPDGSRAYYNDTDTHRVDVFDYDRESGLSNRRPFVEVAPEDGRPDGLTVDAEGGIWVALNHSGTVRRYTTAGAADAVVEVPPRQVTACTFGGARLDELYITTSRENLSPDDDPLAGSLFRGRGRRPGAPGARVRRMIRTLLLLGATGDLARRFLLPALGALDAVGRLPEGFRVVGAARTDLDDDGFRRLAGGDVPANVLTYRTVDLGDPSSLAAALDGTQDPVAVYLALPPAVFATTIESLGEVDLPSGSRVAIEKPFGDDLESARALNALLGRTGMDAYRVDHVLGMETTQNLVAMRHRSPVLARLWNGDRVERVEILWEETLALEGRAGYYDAVGALRDVMQSHMVQLLVLVGMEPPADDVDLQRQKLDVVRTIRVVESRRARYTEGRLADGRHVPSYADEEDVDPVRCTETFAEVEFELETPRWDGTRFVLRTGKALADRRKLVLLRLRGGEELELGIDGPEDVVLRLAGDSADPLELRAPPPGPGLPPYAHVLRDLLAGTSALSVSGEGAEWSWRVIAPVRAAWEAGDVPLAEYPAGTAGPS